MRLIDKSNTLDKEKSMFTITPRPGNGAQTRLSKSDMKRMFDGSIYFLVARRSVVNRVMYWQIFVTASKRVIGRLDRS